MDLGLSHTLVTDRFPAAALQIDGGLARANG